jgi:hypothetical protein
MAISAVLSISGRAVRLRNGAASCTGLVASTLLVLLSRVGQIARLPFVAVNAAALFGLWWRRW